VIVNVIVVKIVRNVMPNKAAKERKRQRRLKNEWLNRNGRTANQVKRIRKKNGSTRNNR
jgi:molybdopterin biosynthesis enzyme